MIKKIVFIFLILGLLLLITTKNSRLREFTQMDCLEYGVCKEGLSLNTEEGRITITKDYCTSHNYKWNEKTQTCKLY